MEKRKMSYPVITNNIVQNDDDIDNLPDTPMESPSYNNIMKTIMAIISAHKSTSDYECFKSNIGFRILEGRSDHGYDYSRININQEKKTWRQAIKLANEVSMRNKQKKTINYTSNNNKY
jgi:hypothetical protein